MPITRSGRPVTAASEVIGIEDVFDARIASGGKRLVGAAEDVLLDRGVLDDRLDHQVGGDELVDGRRRAPSTSSGSAPPFSASLVEALAASRRGRARSRPGTGRGARRGGPRRRRPARSRRPSGRRRRRGRARSSRRGGYVPACRAARSRRDVPRAVVLRHEGDRRLAQLGKVEPLARGASHGRQLRRARVRALPRPDGPYSLDEDLGRCSTRRARRRPRRRHVAAAASRDRLTLDQPGA